MNHWTQLTLTHREVLADLEAFELHVAGLTYREISERMGWKTPSAAYKAVWRCNRRSLAFERELAEKPSQKTAERHKYVLWRRLFWEEEGYDRPPTYGELAEAFGYKTRSGAWRAVRAALERSIAELDDDLDEVLPRPRRKG